MSRSLLWLAAALLVVPVAALGFGLTHGCGSAVQPLSGRQQARDHLDRIAARLAVWTLPDGRFDRARGQQEASAERDYWERSVRVRYTEDPSGQGEYLWVDSAGPDGEWETADDLHAVRVAHHGPAR